MDVFNAPMRLILFVGVGLYLATKMLQAAAE